MATTTSNYGIRKPAPEDLVNVEADIAEPYDQIDEILATKSDDGHTHASYTTSADVTTAVNNVLAGAPAALNTLDELAAALGDDANFAASVTTSLAGKSPTSHAHTGVYEPSGAIATHEADSTSVHGIADTSLLITAAQHAALDHEDLPGIEANVPIQASAPSSPDVNDLWIDSDEPALSGGGGASILQQDAAPSSPAEDDLWIDTDATPSGSNVPTVSFVLGNNAGDHSTTSTTFVDLAAAYTINMPAAVGDRLEIDFRAIGNHSAANGTINFTFAINGTDQGPTNGIWVDVFVSNGQLYPIHLNYWRTVISGDLSGGNVPIKVRYMGNSGTKTIKNSVAGDYLPVFSVKNWKQ